MQPLEYIGYHVQLYIVNPIILKNNRGYSSIETFLK